MNPTDINEEFMERLISSAQKNDVALNALSDEGQNRFLGELFTGADFLYGLWREGEDFHALLLKGPRRSGRRSTPPHQRDHGTR